MPISTSRRKLGSLEQWHRALMFSTRPPWMSTAPHFRDPAVIHALCNDYRAGATCDVAHDREALDDGVRITCPMLALWGDAGIPGQIRRRSARHLAQMGDEV